MCASIRRVINVHNAYSVSDLIFQLLSSLCLKKLIIGTKKYYSLTSFAGDVQYIVSLILYF